MKKTLLGFLTVVVLLFVGLKISETIYLGGDSYYTQITNEGIRHKDTDNAGQAMVYYDYELPAFDENGNEKELSFSSFKARPLKKEAYLKLTWNKNKGVTSFEEVSEKELPKNVQKKLGGN